MGCCDSQPIRDDANFFMDTFDSPPPSPLTSGSNSSRAASPTSSEADEALMDFLNSLSRVVSPVTSLSSDDESDGSMPSLETPSYRGSPPLYPEPAGMILQGPPARLIFSGYPVDPWSTGRFDARPAKLHLKLYYPSHLAELVDRALLKLELEHSETQETLSVSHVPIVLRLCPYSTVIPPHVLSHAACG